MRFCAQILWHVTGKEPLDIPSDLLLLELEFELASVVIDRRGRADRCLGLLSGGLERGVLLLDRLELFEVLLVGLLERLEVTYLLGQLIHFRGELLDLFIFDEGVGLLLIALSHGTLLVC